MAHRGEAKNLPLLLTVTIGIGVAFTCDKLFDFPWWLRLAAVVVVALLTEGVNQWVRRRSQGASQ